jgi:hypothetical protein
VGKHSRAPANSTVQRRRAARNGTGRVETPSPLRIRTLKLPKLHELLRQKPPSKMRVRESTPWLGILAALTGTGNALAPTTWSVAKVDSTTTTTSSSTVTPTPCTAKSPGGAFYDLRPDIAVLPADGAKPHQGTPVVDYTAKGYDYGANFTLNICDAVVKPPKDVAGVDSSAWRNISAYYESKDGRIYSLGFVS